MKVIFLHMIIKYFKNNYNRKTNKIIIKNIFYYYFNNHSTNNRNRTYIDFNKSI